VLLVRIFGQSDGLLNRVSENEIYKELSSSGVSPRLLGLFPWGRLEEYLTKNVPLRSGTDMVSITEERDCVSLIAKALARLHKIELSLDASVCSANIFDVLSKWVELASKYGDTIKSSPRCSQFTPPSISQLRTEIGEATNLVKSNLLSNLKAKNSAVCQVLVSQVLCHNDLLSGNIMLDADTNSVRLIDFEYSGLNYAVADIANLFTAVCESIMLSGHPQDVRNNFPSREIQLHFLECYLGHPVEPSEVEIVLVLILAFAMMDELRWTIWGIIQANQSTVDFDYVFYYNSRFDAYKCYKSLLTERLSGPLSLIK
jgi:thiamine kinase-like enzyme